MKKKKQTPSAVKDKAPSKIKETLLLLLLTVIFASVYQGAMKLYFYYVIHIYTAASSILIVVYFLMNRGFSKEMPEKEQLPDAMTDAEKTEYLEKLKGRKEKARKLIFFIFPLLISLLIDWVLVFFT